MLRAIPLLSVLVLLLSSPSQTTAALVSAAPASLPPATFENASTAFFEGGSESRIGLLCHNDPVNKSDPTGLLDIYVGIEADLVPIFGAKVAGGIVVDFSKLSNSGLFGSLAFAGGGNVGIGVGGGFALRDVERTSINGDVNLGKVSVTATMDEKGFNGMGASVGPGIGASASKQETKTLTFPTIGNWIKSLFNKEAPRPIPGPDEEKKTSK